MDIARLNKAKIQITATLASNCKTEPFNWDLNTDSSVRERSTASPRIHCVHRNSDTSIAGKLVG
jgi:hypothetical protein